MEKINQLKNIIDRNTFLKDSLEEKKEKIQEDISAINNEASSLTELKDFLMTVSANYRDQLCNLFTSLVTEALTSIFEKDIRFNIRLYSYRNEPAIDISVIEDNLEVDPQKSCGGGLNDVISFVIKIIFIYLKRSSKIIILDEPLTNSRYMKPTWQRWYVLDILEMNGVNYDQVAMVDVDTMVRWDAPNFFELTDRKFSAVVDQDNIGWVKQSIEAYQHMFKDVKLDWTDYFNCGFVVVNEKHKELCYKILKFWDDNDGELQTIQLTIQKGTDQTPVNYMAFKYFGSKINYFPKTFNSKLTQKRVAQFHKQTDKVQLTMVKQAMEKVLG